MSALENHLVKEKKRRTVSASSPKIRRVTRLEKKLQRLKDLCQNLDPYKPLDAKLVKELEYFKIYEHNDPFRVTNQLLILMEDMLEELDFQTKME